MKKNFDRNKALKTTLQLLVYFAVGYFVYVKLNGYWDDLINFQFARIHLLVLAILVYSLHSFWNARSWHKMMLYTDETVKKSEQADVYLRSYLLRYIPGNVVGILARGYFNKDYGVKMFKSLWGWFFENIIYLLVGLLIGSYALISINVNPTFLYIGMAVMVIGGVLGLFKIEWLEYIFEKLLAKRLPKDEKVEDYSLGLDLGERFMLAGRYVISWAIASVSYILVVYGVIDFGAGDILPLISINAMAWAIGYLSFITPSGGGVREGVMFTLLSVYGGYSPTVALVITVSARVVFIFGELLALTAFYTPRAYLKLKDNTNE